MALVREERSNETDSSNRCMSIDDKQYMFMMTEGKGNLNTREETSLTWHDDMLQQKQKAKSSFVNLILQLMNRNVHALHDKITPSVHN